MAQASFDFVAAVSGYSLVPGSPGSILALTRMIFTGWAPTRILLLSDPGGEDEHAIGSYLYFDTAPLVLDMGRGGALLSDRGKGLGFSTLYAATVAPYSISLWYEVLP